MTESESFLDGKVILHPGDCLDVMPTLAANSIDACVCDPPYGLGFMGKAWDHGVPGIPYWKAVFRVLKPGGHLIAFGGTRTFGRMHVAIEDAGFEIRDMLSWLYGSGFPKSLDVSKAIDKAAGVERQVVGVRELWGNNAKGGRGGQYANGHAGEADGSKKPFEITEASTAAAKQWDGFGTALKPACEPIVLARKPLSESTVAANVLKLGTGALNIDGCRVATGDKISPRGSMDAQTDIHEGWSRPWMQDKSKSDARLTAAIEKAETLGRWPANVIHDGSDEVVGAFPAEAGAHAWNGGGGKRPGGFGNVGHTNGDSTPSGFSRGDSGSAARFFYQVQSDVRCQLCDVNIAVNQSRTESTRTAGSVRCDVAASPPRESEATAHQSSAHASSAENHSKQCHQPNGGFVPSSAEQWHLSKIVQNVSDAASLCILCATAIAQELAEVRRSGKADPSRFKCSIGGSRETILSRSLASYVRHRESTDTILTTTNLRELFGCVFHAIAENINSERVGSAASTKPAPKRLWYSSKADADDRLGSKHPTVKPLDLMQWLVRLVTPKGGTVLDPFAGTGTTGEAAFREGMRAILIERETEYQNDIRRRMAHALAGPEERKRTIAKAKHGSRPLSDGLFAAMGDRT